MVSRLQYDARGRALGGDRAPGRHLGRPAAGSPSLDIGWSSPTTLALAHRLSGDLFQVRTLSVDGAPAGVAGLATTVQGRPRALVASPRAPTRSTS